MVMTPKEKGAVFRSEIPVTDVRRSEVWLRVAEVAEDRLPPAGTGFELGLEDTAGVRRGSSVGLRSAACLARSLGPTAPRPCSRRSASRRRASSGDGLG